MVDEMKQRNLVVLTLLGWHNFFEARGSAGYSGPTWPLPKMRLSCWNSGTRWEGTVGLLEDVDGPCRHIVHSKSSTPDPEISHQLTEEELDDLAASDSRAFVRRGVRHSQVVQLLFGYRFIASAVGHGQVDGFMKNYSTSFSWFTGFYQFVSTFGHAKRPANMQGGPISDFTMGFASILRCSHNVLWKWAKEPLHSSLEGNSWEGKVSGRVWTPLAVVEWAFEDMLERQIFCWKEKHLTESNITRKYTPLYIDILWI